MLDEDLQVELFHLEIEIHEAALADDITTAAELRTQWFEKSLASYDREQLIELLRIQLNKWKQAIEQAIPEAIKVYTDRILLLIGRIEE